MGLLKDFRPVASPQGRRKICKSRGALSRKICFYSGNINIERRGAGKRGVELGHLPIGPPGSDGPCRWYMSARHSFLFSSIFFFIMPWWFRGSVEISAFKLNILQVVANGGMMSFSYGGRKSTQKYAKVFNLQKLLSEQIPCHAVSYIY